VQENKTCVVTGGTRGLGNLIARTFVESGASRLAILDLDAGEAQAAAAEVVQWFEDHGQAEKGEVEALGIGCNVASEESVTQAMKQIKERFGSIDVVVNR
jgi:NAD(P)-dependent dehydrogenase (short-subunit alcohol dehydrogenase family)